MGHIEIFETLITQLADTNASVRSGAAEALGRLKDKRAVTPLISLL
jgi:HEAT repeat protein